MTIERKEELRRSLLKVEMFTIGALVTFCAGRCAESKTVTNDGSNESKTYYAAPIAMKNENGETIYVAPKGWTLAYDENGKPYCYQTIITNDGEIKTLKKSK